jgi:hypothetical protein
VDGERGLSGQRRREGHALVGEKAGRRTTTAAAAEAAAAEEKEEEEEEEEEATVVVVEVVAAAAAAVEGSSARVDSCSTSGRASQSATGVSGRAGRSRAWMVWINRVIEPAALVIQRAVRSDNAITELAGRRWQRDEAMARAADVAYSALHAAYKAVEKSEWWIVHRRVQQASAIAAAAARRAKRLSMMAAAAAEKAKVHKWVQWLEAAIPLEAGPWWQDPHGGAREIIEACAEDGSTPQHAFDLLLSHMNQRAKPLADARRAAKHAAQFCMPLADAALHAVGVAYAKVAARVAMRAAAAARECLVQVGTEIAEAEAEYNAELIAQTLLRPMHAHSGPIEARKNAIGRVVPKPTPFWQDDAFLRERAEAERRRKEQKEAEAERLAIQGALWAERQKKAEERKAKEEGLKEEASEAAREQAARAKERADKLDLAKAEWAQHVKEEAQTDAALLAKGAAAEKIAEEAAARARAAEEAEAEEEEERRRKAKAKREADGAIVNTKTVEKPPTPDAELQLCLVCGAARLTTALIHPVPEGAAGAGMQGESCLVACHDCAQKLKEQQRKKDHGICPAPGCKQRVMQILYLITPYDAVDKVSGTARTINYCGMAPAGATERKQFIGSDRLHFFGGDEKQLAPHQKLLAPFPTAGDSPPKRADVEGHRRRADSVAKDHGLNARLAKLVVE